MLQSQVQNSWASRLANSFEQAVQRKGQCEKFGLKDKSCSVHIYELWIWRLRKIYYVARRKREMTKWKFTKLWLQSMVLYEEKCYSKNAYVP